MPGMNPSGLLSFDAGGAIARLLRVKLSSGVLAVAGLADGPGVELGTMDDVAFAAGDKVCVRARNLTGSRKTVANAALAVGAKVYTAASGKVGASATGAFLEGIALTASGADGDIIEVLTDPGEVAVP